ncbi:MAG: hypothetical protein CBD74_03460 [Saprospirales bacterium TMED214]|nr:MAG: hypothetical protein CBD74_03460 [Saprospirales bacterium TMED214]
MTADANECDARAVGMLNSSVVQVGLLLVVCALFVRGAVCWRSLDQYAADPDAYRAIAETVGVTGVFGLTAASGEIVATAFRPPLYPTLLSLFLVDQHLPNAAVASLHTLLGAVAVLFTYLAGLSMLPRDGGIRQGTAVRATTGHRGLTGLWGPSLAAILVLIDPLLLKQSTVVMTETFATTLVCIVFWWWAAYRTRINGLVFAVVLGGVLSLAFLVRPTFIAWAILLVSTSFLFEVFGFAHFSKLAWKQRLINAAMPSLVVLSVLFVVVGGWVWRNVRSVGHPVWATTHGGYTLLLGNNPSFYDYLQSGSKDGTWDSASFQVAYSHRYDGDPRNEEFWQRRWEGPRRVQDPAVIKTVTEHSDDLLAYESAKAVIGRQPAMFLWAAGVRICRLWSPFPHALDGRASWLVAMVGIYSCGLYVAMFVGCYRLRSNLWTSNWLPVLTLFVTLTAVHAVYWSNIRMRAPAIPAIALLAACAISPPRVGIHRSSDMERDAVCG